MQPPRTVWQAMARRDHARSGWPWRSAAYLLTGAVAGLVTLVALVVTAAAGAALTLALVGLPLLAAVALAGLPVAALERRRLRLMQPVLDPEPEREREREREREPVRNPHRTPDAHGPWGWLRTRVRERATWRELGHAVLFATVLWPLDALALSVGLLLPLAVLATPLLMATAGNGDEARVAKLWTVTSWPGAWASALLGAVLLVLGTYVLGVAAGARAALARLLLTAPAAELDARVTELTRSRARLVDAFEAERRRIERDLHDGAQQRLVALTMTLGLARLDAPPGPLADQLAKAHDEATGTLSELRELIHGIHPQVLTDYGLAAALTDAADRSPVPVDVHLDLPEGHRPPRAVESAAYFVASEALTNIARHSGATRATVTGTHEAGRLTLLVRDDGRGGADPGGGTGLTGLADRVSVLDGRLTLTSPPGGPTELRVELPCPLPPSAPDPSA
ncbi:sensor histidine kinase [Streptomyces sp. NPDC050400]|uniref:sensor histidine kinase n=1 Tax=Streptomyces sp. NPDC050400 TaxID=3365610 RepID=UPI0037B1BA20